jgi:hypothetical protein
MQCLLQVDPQETSVRERVVLAQIPSSSKVLDFIIP